MYHNEIHKFVTGKVTNFKIGTRIDLGKFHLMDQKYPKGGVDMYNMYNMSMGRIYKFLDPP